MSDTRQRPGAVRLGGGDGGRRGGAGWLKWLLPLLLLAAIVIALIALLGGDDDKASSAGGAKGSLVAGDDDLLPPPSKGLDSYVGQEATGNGVTVQSVVKGEGFWVGTSKQDRVYVEYGGTTGENEQDAFRPAVGDKVDLTGPVRPAPQDPASALHLTSGDAQLVAQTGGFINANDVKGAN